MTEVFQRRGRFNRLGAAGVTAGTLVVSSLHHLADLSHVYWHDIFQFLYYFPTVLAAILFGLRGGLSISLLAALSHLPYVVQASRADPYYAIEQTVEMSLLCLVGALTGALSDRDRRQRRELERTTNRLTEVYRELEQNFEQMKRAERLFAVGQLAAGLAHELRNPLWSIAGASGILKRNAQLEAKHRECVDIIQQESERLNRLLTEFLDFARPRPPKYQSIDADALLDSVIQLAAHAVGHSAVRLRKATAPGLPAMEGDPEMIKQLLLNLVINAIQAMPQGGEVVVSAGLQDGKMLLGVQDQGCGIAPDIRDKIFNPFFTTKDGGTGLGLAVAHQIVEQHGGILRAEANPGGGMTFSALLPPRRETSL